MKTIDDLRHAFYPIYLPTSISNRLVFLHILERLKSGLKSLNIFNNGASKKCENFGIFRSNIIFTF